ncbi:MAG: DUF1517 domain-containing protein [Hormoscilla sp. GUM202]|nr:DUF1517 domain-containing protein [Hormoscilla sp. GUM202]
MSSETLSNVNGQIREREAVSPESDKTADYIVVTLLVGTEDDKPLFAEVNTLAELESALKRIAATPPDYLLTFELLLSPLSISPASVSVEGYISVPPTIVH